METSNVYCPGCNHKVRLTLTPGHLDGAQANLPEGGQVVCLDFGQGCSEGACPLTGRPGIVMGVRLAKSHLPHEARMIHATCTACGSSAPMEVLDAQHAVCSLCESTNRYVTLKLNDESEVTITE